MQTPYDTTTQREPCVADAPGGARQPLPVTTLPTPQRPPLSNFYGEPILAFHPSFNPQVWVTLNLSEFRLNLNTVV